LPKRTNFVLKKKKKKKNESKRTWCWGRATKKAAGNNAHQKTTKAGN